MLIMPVFLTSFELSLLLFVIVLWFLSEIIGSGIIPMLRRSGGAIKRKETSSNMVLRVLIIVSVIVAITLNVYRIAMLPNWIFYPGIVLMVIGIIVRQWANSILGRFFTATVSVQKNQKVVDQGPYRFIRHPSYLGMFLTFIGVGVALQSWLGILVIAVLFGIAIGYRIHIEERVLVIELGDDYVRYMKRTKRLIPFVF